jgi:hypothetical protein
VRGFLASCLVGPGSRLLSFLFCGVAAWSRMRKKPARALDDTDGPPDRGRDLGAHRRFYSRVVD